MELLDLYKQGSEWTASKIPAATTQLDRRTRCEEWDVRTLLNHLVDTQEYFAATARGEDASPPGPSPPDYIGGDPKGAYDRIRHEVIRAYSQPGVVEKTGPSLGIAFTDLLVHGSDLAAATGQDATIPDDLAKAAFSMIDGRLTDDRRGNAFKPAVKVGDDASATDRLLAYTGRQP